MAQHTDIQRHFAIIYIALIALLIPVAGPAVDHHFFERFASHAHVYLDEPDLDHGHSYDSTTSDAELEASNYVATSSDGPSTGSVTFLADGPDNTDLLSELEDDILSLFGEQYQRPKEIVLALPEQPPQTDSPLLNVEFVDRPGIG